MPSNWCPRSEGCVPTPFVYVYPEGFTDEVALHGVDIYEYSESFTWEQDEYNGLLDTHQPVQTTLERNRGDCEDIAVLSASWALAHGRHNIRLGFCIEWPIPVPRHVIALDSGPGEERVYSSGHIFEMTADEYIADSEYDYILTRQL